MHDTRWAILFANAATDAAVLVDDGVATFENANGVLGAHLYAYATRHASVLFVLCFVFASGASLFPAGRGCAGEARGLLGRKGCSHGWLLFTYFYICECFRWRGGDAGAFCRLSRQRAVVPAIPRAVRRRRPHRVGTRGASCLCQRP